MALVKLLRVKTYIFDELKIGLGAHLIRGVTLVGLLFCSSALYAQDFVDTTSGSPDEKAHGIRSDDHSERSQRIINSFKEGRLSSAKKNNSRFAGNLEFHDSNMDGVADHEASNFERNINNLLGNSGSSILEKTRESSKKANVKGCDGNENGTTTDASNSPLGYTACFNPSGIIVDKGAAHGGEFSSHRTLKLSDEAIKLSDEQGERMGNQTISDIKASLLAEMSPEQRREFEADPNRKVDGLDLLRSESIWAEDLKESLYERDWKKLRAARLAGEDGVSKTAEGSLGATMMARVDEIYGKGGTDEDVAQAIAAFNTAKGVKMVRQGNNWVPENTPPSPGATAPTTTLTDTELKALAAAKAGKSSGREFDDKLRDLQRKNTDQNGFGSLSMEELSIIGVDEATRRQVFAAAESNVMSNERSAETIAKTKETILNNGCLNAEVWCHNQQTANAATTKAWETNPNAASIDPYAVHKGDPGDVFQDTREIINIKAQKAMNVPVAQMRQTLLEANADINENTHPEVFEHLTQLENAAKKLQEDTEKMGGKGVFDSNKQTSREMFGIKKGINDSWSDGGNVLNRGPRSGLRDPSSTTQAPPNTTTPNTGNTTGNNNLRNPFGFQ